MVNLRSYQKEALEAIVNSEDKGVTKQLVVLPTGTGKTVVFSHIPIYRKNSLPMLVLAHREELLFQAKEKILASNPDLKVEIEKAEHVASDNCDVVIASVPTLGRTNSKRIAKFDPNYFKTIVVDEAHHSAAKTYGNVLEYFNPDLLVGVTATPQRSDGVRLTDRFDEVTYYYSMEDAMVDGYLVPLSGYRITSDVDISSVGIRAGDYIESELAQAININERNDLIVDSYLKLAEEKKAVVFCSTVQHAHDLAKAFRDKGIVSESLVGDTESDKRSSILEGLRSGKIKVVTNVGVLTEGFNEPSIECVILARPTRSTLLYTQIVGRGTRLNEGKSHCIIIDIADTTKGKKPLGLPTLLGLPPDFDLEGEDLLSAANEFAELEKKSPAEASKVTSLKDIELAWEQIDLFAAPKPSAAVMEYSTLIWAEISENSFYLNLGQQESVHISTDPLGRYVVTLSKAGVERPLGIAKDIREAFSRSDQWVKTNRKENLQLLDSNAQWRSDGPTDKQIKWLKKFGVPITADMTKGQASQILDKLFADTPSPASKRPKWLQDKINKSKVQF